MKVTTQGRYHSARPTEYLWRAMHEPDPGNRKCYAEIGLNCGDGLDLDTECLLTRQLFLAHLDLGELDTAAEVARRMVALDAMPEIAFQDLARVLKALGDSEAAIQAQRQAARVAAPTRRSFVLLGLATLQHAADDRVAALETLARAHRWSTRDRALLRGYQALLRIEMDEPVENLQQVRDDLMASPSAEGYGRYVLGMIGYRIRDFKNAEPHLRAFLRRHARASGAQRVTLFEELRAARRAVASLSSH